MKKKEARKLCKLIWEKQNIVPPIELLLIGYPNKDNIHEWTQPDKL